VSNRDVVITGLGVVSPIGIGVDKFWASLLSGASGVRTITSFDTSGTPLSIGAEVLDFDPKEYVKPRKSLKVMSRDIQFGVTVADLACAHAGIVHGTVAPERFGVEFAADMMHCPLDEVEMACRASAIDGKVDLQLWGREALAHIFPLWMLKYLPNMPACHIAIAHDARGPNNSHSVGEASSLLAMAEAARVIQRGSADVVVTGGTSSKMHPILWFRESVGDTSHRGEIPAAACRPFELNRDGAVHGEGATAFVFESRAHAAARNAPILARVLGYACAFEPRRNGAKMRGAGIRSAITVALRSAGLSPKDIGHVNAHGLSTIADDRAEAAAIRDLLGDVPVTAPKSYFGNTGASTGALEAAVSVMALVKQLVPATLNYQTPDPECPVRVISGEPLRESKGVALLLNHSPMGQAAALILAAE
jgi:3-oxoacyl-[acyl-carrier-protein] synthase II